MTKSEHSRPHNPRAAIVRAKREWECIADSLPQILCLLNRNAEILRANLTVERWNLVPVRDALGLSMHELLHRDCVLRDCRMRAELIDAWQELLQVGASRFELVDQTLGRSITIEFKEMPNADSGDIRMIGSHAVCIVSDVTQLRHAQENQRALNEELERRVQDRTRELSKAVRGLQAEIERRENAEHSLRNSRNELSRLSDKLMQAQETERQRIAQELHDSVGQSLSAIKYSLERTALMLASPQLGNPVKVLNRTVELVQLTIDDVRTISENLRPALLDGLGAVSAIRWLCREWGEVFTGITVDTNLHVADGDIPETLETALFRTVQETLNNVARHSKATRVSISVIRERGCLRVEMVDNGVGFDPDGSTIRRGYGLSGIRERTTNTGGSFSLSSYPGGGTHLTLLWPIAKPPIQGKGAVCVA